MPSPSEPLADERFGELAALLRDARPRPSDRLREQVRELALAPEPPPERRRSWLAARRLVPLVAVLALAIAAVGGIGTLATRDQGSSGGDLTADAGAYAGVEEAQTGADPMSAKAAGAAPPATQDSGALTQRESAALPPATGRAQQYRAELSVRVAGVGELAETTSRAMRITRSLGGYVVAASYDEPGDADGDSRLVVRVPTARIQDAIARFSQLGTILSQHIVVTDLQAQIDRQADAIAAIKRTIVRLETQLTDTTLSTDTRERLRLQLVEAQRNLASREGATTQTRRRAATARISLTLTTRDEAQAVVPVPESGDGFGDVVRDALSVVAVALTWTLAALIVASPLLLLALLLVLGLRMRRRAEERRLLGRPAAH